MEKDGSYGSYQTLSFKTFLGLRGDNFDRFILRVKETSESLRLLAALLAVLSERAQPTATCGALVLLTGCRAWLPVKQESCFFFFLFPAFFASLDLIVGPLSYKSVASVESPIHLASNDAGLLRKGPFTSMEATIEHFKLHSDG